MQYEADTQRLCSERQAPIGYAVRGRCVKVMQSEADTDRLCSKGRVLIGYAVRG